MYIKTKILFSLAILLSPCKNLNAQAEIGAAYPEIGITIPDFVLKDIKYYSKPNASRADFEGKHLILDFFSQSCIVCFENFPKTSAISREFKPAMDIILVGSILDENIEKTYEKFREKQKLELPVTFESNLVERWNIRYFPFLLWIDNKGIVKAITAAGDLTSENVIAFLKGETFDFHDKSNLTTRSLGVNLELLPNSTDGHSEADTDFLFKSLLAAWPPNAGHAHPITISADLDQGMEQSQGRFAVTGATVWMLYQYAFFGSRFSNDYFDNFYNRPIILGDSAVFLSDYNTGKNIFNYSLVIPDEKASRKALQNVMQHDLASYFDKKAVIENSKVTCWVLSATKGGRRRLESKRNNSPSKTSFSEAHWYDVTVDQIIKLIKAYHPDEPPILNETGIGYNIDLDIDALMTDIDDISRSLAEQGLILRREKRVVPALVIRDSK